jgi:hypothetical protein
MAKLAKEVEIIVEEPEIEVIIEGPDTDDEHDPDDEHDTDDEMSEDTSVGLSVPKGGIGGFAMSEEDFSALEAEETKKEFGEEGLAQFTAVAKRMAGHGRFGDDSVAHIQTGEMVIPLTLLNSNPALKAQIFKGLREKGIEDPEQYVVGSKANSINPETGLMEFGFVSDIYKSVKKFVKEIAPIVLPVALSLTPLGPVYGAALGSGIGTLVNGGSATDALKSGLIAGAAGAVYTGFSGKGNFVENIGNAVSDPLGRVTQTVSGAGTSLENVFGASATKAANVGEPGFFSAYAPIAQGASPGTGIPDPPSRGYEILDTEGKTIGTGGPTTDTEGKIIGTPVSANLVANDPTAVPNPAEAVAPTGTIGTLEEAPGFFESMKGAITPDDGVDFGGGVMDAFAPNSPTASEVLIRRGFDPATAPKREWDNAEKIAKDLAPSLMRKYAPVAALAASVGSAAGFFDTPEDPPLELVERQPDGTATTGFHLFEENPADFLVSDLGSRRFNPKTGKYEDVNSDGTIGVPDGDTSAYSVSYEEGGPIFPRRNGGIAPTEGVEGRDSVRAMLMPGEFVMTADAVRGLGNGNLNSGIKSMYSVMRNLESRGRATA